MLWMKAPALMPLRTASSSEVPEAPQPVAALIAWLEMIVASGAIPIIPELLIPPAAIDAT